MKKIENIAQFQMLIPYEELEEYLKIGLCIVPHSLLNIKGKQKWVVEAKSKSKTIKTFYGIITTKGWLDHYRFNGGILRDHKVFSLPPSSGGRIYLRGDPQDIERFASWSIKQDEGVDL